MKGSLSAFLDLLYQKSPRQKKYIEAFLASCDDTYFERAEHFTQGLIELLARKELPLDYAVDAYIQLCSVVVSEKFFL
ncbi:MAG: hypothetical protein PHH28_17170 [Desulfuromonadaceae bacterium]|nr:hypothetical protein [Desulfuromonadaceae bacterium]